MRYRPVAFHRWPAPAVLLSCPLERSRLASTVTSFRWPDDRLAAPVVAPGAPHDGVVVSIIGAPHDGVAVSIIGTPHDRAGFDTGRQAPGDLAVAAIAQIAPHDVLRLGGDSPRAPCALAIDTARDAADHAERDALSAGRRGRTPGHVGRPRIR